MAEQPLYCLALSLAFSPTAWLSDCRHQFVVVQGCELLRSFVIRGCPTLRNWLIAASRSAGRVPRSQRGKISEMSVTLSAGGACRHLLLVRKRTLTAKYPSRHGGGLRSACRWASRWMKTRTVRTRQDSPPPKCNKPISSRRCNSPFLRQQFPWGSAGPRQREAPDLPAKQ